MEGKTIVSPSISSSRLFARLFENERKPKEYAASTAAQKRFHDKALKAIHDIRFRLQAEPDKSSGNS